MSHERGMAISVGLIAIVAVHWVLYVAGAVFAPIALALFNIAIVWPVQSWLQARMPRFAALTISILATLVVFVVLASLVAWALGRVGQSVVNEAARYQTLYDDAVTWLETLGVSVTGFWSEHFNAARILGIVQQITSRLSTLMTFWAVSIVYLILGLLEVEAVQRKVQALRKGDAGRLLIDASIETAAKFRAYLLVRTQMSVLTGMLVWLVAWMAGLQFAAEWGVIAFVLNYVPFIGPFLATLCPTLFALVQFGSWQSALTIFLGLNVVQIAVGTYLEPLVSGRALSLSPVVVLFSVFFWTFMWGMFGAFIGVPITIALLTFAAQTTSFRWLSDVLGGDS